MINQPYFHAAHPELFEICENNKWLIYHTYKEKWEDDKPGWHEVLLLRSDNDSIDKLHENVLKYLYENVPGCEKHCRWIRMGNALLIKFRHEKDYMWFKLRWL